MQVPADVEALDPSTSQPWGAPPFLLAMDPHATSSPESRDLEEAIRIARIQLGPRSAALLSRPQYQALLRSRLAGAPSLEDAVYGLVFEYGREDQEVSNEFFGSFLATLHAKGRRLVRGGLERYLGSQDLVQSVLGDLFAKPFKFSSRAEFLAYLDQGMRWKASAARGSAASERQLDVDAEECATVKQNSEVPPAGPLTRLEDEEERELLALGMTRLEPPAQELLQRWLRGESIAQIAEATGRSVEATKSALARARKKILDAFPKPPDEA